MVVCECSKFRMNMQREANPVLVARRETRLQVISELIIEIS